MRATETARRRVGAETVSRAAVCQEERHPGVPRSARSPSAAPGQPGPEGEQERSVSARAQCAGYVKPVSPGAGPPPGASPEPINGRSVNSEAGVAALRRRFSKTARSQERAQRRRVLGCARSGAVPSSSLLCNAASSGGVRRLSACTPTGECGGQCW